MALCYNNTTKEIAYGTKTFIIDHPVDKDKYLVHACVESPNTELIYRGKDEIINNEFVSIQIPDYALLIGFDWSINLTPIGKSFNALSCSELNEENGTFDVYGNNGKFYWTVYGQRTRFAVEPNKSELDVKGDGPYKWAF